MNQYHLLELASKDFLIGIDTFWQARLPQELFPGKCLKSILCKAQTIVKKRYIDYQLAADHISIFRM